MSNGGSKISPKSGRPNAIKKVKRSGQRKVKFDPNNIKAPKPFNVTGIEVKS